MSEIPDLSKEAQLERASTQNQRLCKHTGETLRKCKCKHCRGRKNRKKGQAGQRVARQALGLTGERWKGREANEETWTAALRVEVKAGGNMANPVGLRYDKMRVQAEQAKAIGDARPFIAAVKPDGWSDVVVMVKGSDLPDVVAALMEEWSA
jgi:hypothetical protein